MKSKSSNGSGWVSRSPATYVMLSRVAFCRAMAIITGDLSIPTTWPARGTNFGVSGPSPQPASRAFSHGTGTRSRSQRWKGRLWLQGVRALGARPDAELIDVLQQSLRAGKRFDLRQAAPVSLRVQGTQAVGLSCRQVVSGLADKRAHKQATAHSNAAMDAPDGERDARRFERLLPREHVLIDAVEKSAVKVEEHRRTVCVNRGRRIGRPRRWSHQLTVDSLSVTPSIKLGRLFGIEIGFNWSLIFIFALVTWTLATAVLPANAPGHGALVYWLVGAAGAVLFYVSLLAHELSHALVAVSHGVKVAGITLWLFGGVSRLEGEPTSARSEALIAGVGPLTSLLIAAISVGLFYLTSGNDLLSGLFGWLAFVNLALALFNLVPAFPLDGGRLLSALLWWRSGSRQRGVHTAVRVGRVFAYLMIAAGVLEVLLGAVFNGRTPQR